MLATRPPAQGWAGWVRPWLRPGDHLLVISPADPVPTTIEPPTVVVLRDVVDRDHLLHLRDDLAEASTPGGRFLVLYADPVDVDLFEGDDRWTVAFAVQNRRRRRGPGRLAVISRRWES